MAKRTTAGVRHVTDTQLSHAERALVEMAARGELPELDPSTMSTGEDGLDDLHAVLEAAVGGPEALEAAMGGPSPIYPRRGRPALGHAGRACAGVGPRLRHRFPAP